MVGGYYCLSSSSTHLTPLILPLSLPLSILECLNLVLYFAYISVRVCPYADRYSASVVAFDLSTTTAKTILLLEVMDGSTMDMPTEVGLIIMITLVVDME